MMPDRASHTPWKVLREDPGADGAPWVVIESGCKELGKFYTERRAPRTFHWRTMNQPAIRKKLCGYAVGSLMVDNKKNPWHGTRTFEDWQELVRTGWKEGANKMRGSMGSILRHMGHHNLFAEREREYPEVYGSRFDLDAYLAGEPESMVAVEEDTGQHGMVLKLGVGYGYNCDCGEQEIFNHGAAVALLVEWLTKRGVSVELTAVHCSHAHTDYSDSVVHFTTLKEAGKPMTLDALAVALAHKGSFRRTEFRQIETWPTPIWDRHYWGYGRTFHHHVEGLAELFGLEYMIPGLQPAGKLGYNLADVEHAKKFLEYCASQMGAKRKGR